MLASLVPTKHFIRASMNSSQPELANAEAAEDWPPQALPKDPTVIDRTTRTFVILRHGGRDLCVQNGSINKSVSPVLRTFSSDCLREVQSKTVNLGVVQSYE